MTVERQAHVFIVLPGRTDFVHAGRFRRVEAPDDPPCGEFIYARHYLERPDAVELDPVELRLPVRRHYTARLNGFFGAIRDAMPDQWGRHVRGRQCGDRPPDEFDYLIRGGGDRAGALGFARDHTPPEPQPRVHPMRDLDRLRRAAQAIALDRPVPGAQAHLLEATSMGGARPKTVLQDGPVLWLVKFGRLDDRWNYPRVEHALLALARKCGLEPADSRIERMGGHDMLLVRRFDREWAGTGYRRARMVSAMTVLRSEDDPRGPERWSYLLLADELRRISACPRRDLRELFGRMCFNALVSNLDDHPRNHALIAPGRAWRLSPAYDLNPMPLPGPEARDLAMTCGRYGRAATRSNLLSGHARFLLSEDEAAGILDHVTAAVRAHWYAAMRRAGVTERDCETIRAAFCNDGLCRERLRS